MDAVIEENPDCEEYLKKFKFRSDNYWHQLNALNVAGVWKDYDGFVLSMWGEYDWATHKEEHVLITKIVNKKNPNKASFIEVPNSDHKMMLVADSKEKSKAFNTQIAKIIVEWTKTKMGEVSN